MLLGEYGDWVLLQHSVRDLAPIQFLIILLSLKHPVNTAEVQLSCKVVAAHALLDGEALLAKMLAPSSIVVPPQLLARSFSPRLRRPRNNRPQSRIHRLRRPEDRCDVRLENHRDRLRRHLRGKAVPLRLRIIEPIFPQQVAFTIRFLRNGCFLHNLCVPPESLCGR